MIKIRLSRRGKNKYATFRIVAAEHTRAAKGKSLEVLGAYNPHTNTVQVDGDRVRHWLSHGAQASPTVHNLLVSQKIIAGPKVAAWKAPKKPETPAAPSAAAPAETPATPPTEAPAA